MHFKESYNMQSECERLVKEAMKSGCKTEDDILIWIDQHAEEFADKYRGKLPLKDYMKKQIDEQYLLEYYEIAKRPEDGVFYNKRAGTKQTDIWIVDIKPKEAALSKTTESFEVLASDITDAQNMSTIVINNHFEDWKRVHIALKTTQR